MVRSFMRLTGVLDTAAPNTGFLMLYGTPKVNGMPFVWSQSSWKRQKLREVPNRIDGSFTLMPLYLRKSISKIKGKLRDTLNLPQWPPPLFLDISTLCR
jgi:hypothetical protein